MDLHLKIWLGWTESVLAVIAASLWLAFANPGRFMKCAEDVTLAPIHFINELLRKLIRHPGPLMLPRNMLAWHKMPWWTRRTAAHFPLTQDTYSVMTHRCLLAHKKIQIAVSVWYFKVKISFIRAVFPTESILTSTSVYWFYRLGHQTLDWNS